MAKAKTQETTQDTEPQENHAAPSAGDLQAFAASLAAEFEKEGAGRVNPDIYWHKMALDKNGEKLNPIKGYLMERRQRPMREDDDGPSFYYVLCLTAPCYLWDGESDDPIYCDPKAQPDGKRFFAWVDERWTLQSLVSYLPKVVQTPGGVSHVAAVNEVLIVPLGQKKLKGGRSVWKAEVYAKEMAATAKPDIPLIAPKTTTPQLPPKAEDAASSDIPF